MKLPRTAQEIADVIGRDAALRLIGQAHRYRPASRKGAEQVCIYVPRELRPDHQLVRLIGYDAAVALVRNFAGMILQPASCAHLYRAHRDRSILRLLSQGLPVKLVAEWFEVCERHVTNLSRAERLHVERRTPANDTRPAIRPPRRA